MEQQINTNSRKYAGATRQKHKTGHVIVYAFSDRVNYQRNNQRALRGTTEFPMLYHICITDDNFKEGALKAHGYLDVIYILEWATTSNVTERTTATNPHCTKRQASGDKVALDCKTAPTN